MGRIRGFVLAVLLLAFLRWSYVSFLIPVDTEDTTEIIIPRGENASVIGLSLKEKNIIDNPLWFTYLAKLLGMDDNIKSGKYLLRHSLSELRVLIYMTRESAGRMEEMVTIYEGSTIRDIAYILSDRIGVDYEKFVNLAYNTEFISRLNLTFPKIGSPPSLEGYLFPDTYKFYWGMSSEDVMKIMLKRLFEVWDKSMEKRAEEIGLDLHKTLTLASIIEKEAKIDSERQLISAVFHNRLRLNRPLEACPTVLYVLPEKKAKLTYQDTKYSSPYNTYIHTGLPPGPIASPGEASIKASLYPAHSNFLYFVAKGDGSHLFAKSIEEHKRNKRRVRTEQRWKN